MVIGFLVLASLVFSSYISNVEVEEDVKVKANVGLIIIWAIIFILSFIFK